MPTAQAPVPTATFITVTSKDIQNVGIIDVNPHSTPMRSGKKAYRVIYTPFRHRISQKVAFVDETNHQAQQEQLELAKLNAEADAHQ